MKVGPLQSFFKSAWDWSCYADCIIKLASQVTGNPLTLQEVGKALDLAIDRKFVRFNEKDYGDTDNFYVNDPAGLLGALTGKRYSVRKEPGSYVCGGNELEVRFMVLSSSDGKKNKGHFVLPDWDPIQGSNTGKYGFVWTKRIFREIN